MRAIVVYGDRSNVNNLVNYIDFNKVLDWIIANVPNFPPKDYTIPQFIELIVLNSEPNSNVRKGFTNFYNKIDSDQLNNLLISYDSYDSKSDLESDLSAIINKESDKFTHIVFLEALPVISTKSLEIDEVPPSY